MTVSDELSASYIESEADTAGHKRSETRSTTPLGELRLTNKQSSVGHTGFSVDRLRHGLEKDKHPLGVS